MSAALAAPVRTVIVSGSGSRPSRTLALTRHIARAVSALLPIELSVIDLADVGPDLGRALQRSQLTEAGESALRVVESAELLIAASPVYRGSYSGHFKHLFDLIHQDALIDVPVILAATGGGDKHCLVIEHQLRPLFAFLQAFAVPVGIYASAADFLDEERTTELVHTRIVTAARQAAELLQRHTAAALPHLAQQVEPRVPRAAPARDGLLRRASAP
jgi:FMN reductase